MVRKGVRKSGFPPVSKDDGSGGNNQWSWDGCGDVSQGSNLIEVLGSTPRKTKDDPGTDNLSITFSSLPGYTLRPTRSFPLFGPPQTV